LELPLSQFRLPDWIMTPAIVTLFLVLPVLAAAIPNK
jgi:hypothetical protein